MLKLNIISAPTMVVVLAVSGCGVVPPKVEYKEYNSSNTGSFGYPFRLAKSILLVRYDNDKGFFVDTAPHEQDADGKYRPLYQISGVDNFRSTTQIKITYIDNTKRPDVVQITTQDNISDTINKVGNVAAAIAPAVVGLVAAKAEKQNIAFKSTLFDPDSSTSTQWQPDPVNAGWCMRVRDASMEQGVPIKAYFAARQGVAAGDFPVPSCVTAVLEIAQCNGPASIDSASTQRLPVTFTSAEQVTPIALPSSGTLKFNSVCGASVTEADKQDRQELTTYLTTLMDNVKKVQAALKK
ncbi:hypothetical protein V4C85_25415 [Ralstonia solanacearum]|uniref:hypothetical protein n=1 Tax=Ralstonia solanacearum TaxID=305 RepID=UPI0007C97D8A|nr:hypothetical protein [Ralstonia solanacearum]OAI58171.1 hypothetical protein RSP597_25805 [Ralstonia solanacearum]